MFETITRRVAKIISNITDYDEEKISLNTRLIEDLNIEPLDALDIITDLEDEFELIADDITYEDFGNCHTVGDLVSLINELY